MRQFRALVAIVALAGFAVGCEDTSQTKPKEQQKADLGQSATPPGNPSTPKSTPPTTPAPKTP